MGGGGGKSSEDLPGIVGNGGRPLAGIGGWGKEASLGAGGRLGRLPGWLGGCVEGGRPPPGRGGGPPGKPCCGGRAEGGTGGALVLPGEGRPEVGTGGLLPPELPGDGNLPPVGGIGGLTVYSTKKTRQVVFLIQQI